MKQASIPAHIRDILLLPFTVTVVVPYFIHNDSVGVIPDHLAFRIIGIIISVCGLSLFLYTVYLFKRIGKGTLAPWSPKQKLVVTGPYRYCRNPMITGVLFILIGESLFLPSQSILTWAAVFFAINTGYFMMSEEPLLEEKFGDDYKAYKENVPRWIPRITPYDPIEKPTN